MQWVKSLGSIPGLGTGSHMPQLRPSKAKLKKKKKNSGNSTNDNKYTWVFCSTKIRTKHRKRGKEKNVKSGERGKMKRETYEEKKLC